MWNQRLLDKLDEIYMGQCESAYEINLVRNCLIFYGEDIYGDHYDIGFDTIMKYRTGCKTNPFVWIEYSPTREDVYQKEV